MTTVAPFTLTLHDPVVMTTPGGDPNSATTLTYIPGSALRGAVARTFRRIDPSHQDWPLFRRLVLDGSVRYLNVYPDVDGRAAVPIPLSWRHAKGAGAAAAQLEALDSLSYDGRPPQGAPAEGHWPSSTTTATTGYATVTAATVRRVVPATSGRTHQQRDRQRGTAWTDPATGEQHGTVYSYQSLDPGQAFRGAVQIRSDHPQEAVGVLRRRLAGGLLFGRSKLSGYGGNASIEWTDDPSTDEVGHEAPLRELITADVGRGGTVRVLLAADYIGRDPVSGQLDPAYLAHEVEEALGGHSVARVTRLRAAYARTGGYNRAWGMPLPEAPTVLAGSVLYVEAVERIDGPRIVALMRDGVGERRIDGFGRVLVLGPPATAVVINDGSSRPVVAAPAGEPPQAVARLEQRLLERQVADRAQRVVAGVRTDDALPPPSLLARLRAPLARGADGLPELRLWLGAQGEGKLRSDARRHLAACHAQSDLWDGSRPLHRALAQLVADDSDLHRRLGFAAVVERYHLTTEQRASAWLDDRMEQWRAAVADALLEELHRRARTTPDQTAGRHVEESPA